MGLYEWIQGVNPKTRYHATAVVFNLPGLALGVLLVTMTYDTTDPGGVLFALMFGVCATTMFLLSYSILKDMDARMKSENVSKPEHNALIKKAMYIAKRNNQEVYLKDFPLSYFKRNGFTSAYVFSGCGVFTKASEVAFKLSLKIDTSPGLVEIDSKRLPIEIAPDWLKATSKFKDAVKGAISDIKDELKDECELESLKKLESMEE